MRKISFRTPLFFVARWFRRLMPRGLYGRTLLIIVLPTILTLCVATYVFFNRHWYATTNRMTHAVAGDIAFVVETMRNVSTEEEREDLVEFIDKKLDLNVSFLPEKQLQERDNSSGNPLRVMLNRALRERVPYPYHIKMRQEPGTVSVRVGTAEGIYTFLIPQRRIYTPTTEVFIAWMIGSSLLLSFIALIFMRNQVRPIRRLAEAAEAIGKGQDVPRFKPEGAKEVRQAGANLLIMRDRLKRMISQRTSMLAGVSHDLRTPLTRMKLQLALMKETDETREIATDIADMEGMVEAYLAFARGEESEAAVNVDLGALLEEIVATLRRQHPDITLNVPSHVEITARRDAMKRCIGNLIGNAVRYGKRAEISVSVGEHIVDIVIDDDGPGIAPEKREDVFRPFLRLDESRNPVTGGIGLGLTIARDIARFHGGNIVLENSPLGGLRARIWLPI